MVGWSVGGMNRWKKKKGSRSQTCAQALARAFKQHDGNNKTAYTTTRTKNARWNEELWQCNGYTVPLRKCIINDAFFILLYFGDCLMCLCMFLFISFFFGFVNYVGRLPSLFVRITSSVLLLLFVELTGRGSGFIKKISPISNPSNRIPNHNIYRWICWNSHLKYRNVFRWMLIAWHTKSHTHSHSSQTKSACYRFYRVTPFK